MRTDHYLDRLKDRVFDAFKGEVHKFDRLMIESSIKAIQNDFDVSKMKSTAICLHKFKVKRRSPWYVNVNDRRYYRTFDIMGKDSTGDELWLIVRSGKIVTVMMRKGIQPLEKLRVNKILDLSYERID